MRTRGVLGPLVAAVAILLVIGRAVSASAVSYAWYRAMGIPRLYWEAAFDGVLLQGGAFLVGSIFAYVNLHAVRRTILAVAMPVKVGNLEVTAMIPGRRITVAAMVLAMLVAAALAVPLTNWTDVAMARHGMPFGEIEGITGKDLGFFVYWLPLEETLYLWALVTVVTVTALVLVLYALTRSLRLQGRRVAASTHVRRHLSVLASFVIGLLAWSYRLDAYDLLAHGSGPDGLFLQVDHLITLRVDLLLAVVCALAAPIVLRTAWTGQLRAAVVTVSVVLGGAVVLRHVLPVAVARGNWLGTAPDRDRDYLSTRAAFSRRAFDVDGIVVDSSRIRIGSDTGGRWTPLLRASLHTRQEVERAVANPMGESGERARSAGTPPDEAGSAAFSRNGPHVGWWVRESGLEALLIGPAIDRNQDWSATHFPVSEFSGTSRPLVVEGRGAPPGVPTWGWPLVGPSQRGLVVVPSGVAAATTAVPMRSGAVRLAHAWALRDPSLLSVHERIDEPSIVTVRDVRERLHRLAPVLVVGRDLMPLYDGRQIVWWAPLYAVSERYPLSQRWAIGDGIYGYFRLGAMAFVESHTGRVRLLPVATPDPVTRSWIRRFPELFATAEEIGATLLAQVPPATERTQLQLQTFARYGARGGSPIGRRLPDPVLVGGRTPPPYLDRSDSTERQATLRWTVPLLNGSDEVDGLITAIGGREPGTRWMPLPSPHSRWRAVVPDSASVMATGTPSRGGARSRIDPPHVLPAPRGFVVWERVRQDTAAGDVIRATRVADGQVMRGSGRTLRELVSRFGGTLDGPNDGAAGGMDRGVQSARAWYDRMRSALQRGDWIGFGTAMDSLGRTLRHDDGGRPPP